MDCPENAPELPNLFDLVEASSLDLIETYGAVDAGPLTDFTAPSDVRLKTDIEKVGTTVYGLPLYRFRYKTGPERFEGVMAQDVLEVMPSAVLTGQDGYYRVDYGRLGIGMTHA
ncbi:tail fiber domain-containing protein [Aestuariivirga sp.]|uniref:tail fiber domain-containing protein n=1 Tax=Aestuariivirga sp. TaxID=2650926 RepID=UPI0039194214